ncbi:hypothetical protein PHET_02047 [Paragonimus heterotremus]|uniref:SCA7 domain-containing protein n=1 Tax=Paragonimus heterotremus TaxID=100268 RepID=A0A8J4TQT6_9TREM|nr:hypothetical protein PHET_02047 [Paragonimus heterotremus]
MESHPKNPWESIAYDFPTDALNEPQDCFNNIKLNDFPFLRSYLPFVDYLVKCKVCNVILLPETVYSHYENRHNNSTLNSEHTTSFLPYRAVSNYHDMVDAVSKRERGNGTKRVRVANKRSKRTACSTERDMLPLEVISETDSLSSLTDDNLKRASNNASEEEGERLREPVLLKLAKSDCHCNQFEGSKPTLPKIDEDSRPSHTDRSVWSIVYNRDQNAMEVNQKSNSPLLPSKKSSNDSPFLLDSGNVYKPMDVSDRGTNNLPTQKCSSYPPTPSVSPHVPSPATSVVSDDLVASSSHSLRPETGVRSISRSSAHSSSSSGLDGPTDTSNYPTIYFGSQNAMKESSHKLPTAGSIDAFAVKANRAGPRRLQRSQSVLSDQRVSSLPLQQRGSLSSCIIEGKDVEVDPYVNSSCPDQHGTVACFVGENDILHAPSKATGNSSIARNGYHSWFENTRGPYTNLNTQIRPTNLPDTLLRRKFSHFQVQNRRRILESEARCVYELPLSPACSSRMEAPGVCGLPNSRRSVFSQNPSINESARPTFAFPAVSHESSPYGVKSDVDEEIDDSFDPLTQCGCLEVDDFKCKNSLLCTVHTMDEKRQVPRRKDLRILMREARERLQLSRQAQTVHRQTGHNFSDMEVPQTVIDLTDDFSGPGGGTEVMIDGSEEDRLRLRFLSSNSSHQRQRMMYRRIPDETRVHFGLNRSRLIDPIQSGSSSALCFPTRFARRVPNRDGSFSVLPGVSYVGDTNDHLYASPCPNITIGGSGEHFITMRQNSVPNESYLNESNSVNANEMPISQLPGRYLALPRRQISTVAVATNSVKRQQQHRQHQQLRRAQLASFQPVQQHWTSSVDCHSALMSNSSVTDPLAVPLLEDANDTSLPTSTELMLPETSRALDGRGSMVETSYGAQVLSGVADPMLITPSSIPSLSYNMRTMAEPQTPHLLPLLNQPMMVNRFARSMYSGTQFVREPQGRVIVDDMREKSITGRSRKTAKSTIRHAGQVFTPSNFTGLLSSRFQSAVAQPQSNPAFLASGRKPNTTVDLLQTRPTVISRTMLHGGSTSDLFPGSTACVNNESVGSIRASSFGPHGLLKPPRFAPKHGPLGFGGTGVVTSSASTHNVESAPNSDAIDLDYCIQASSFITTTSTAHSTSSPIQTTADPPEPSDTINCVTFTNQEPYVTASRSIAVPGVVGSQSANVPVPESAPLCRNRYFVIRPNSIKRPPSLVLRAKRPEVCSLQQTPAHKQHPSDNSQ